MTAVDPAATFTVDLDALGAVGSGLHRPECVLCTARGDVYAADSRGGVTRIAPDGSQRLFGITDDGGRDEPIKPNGIALRRDDSFLLTDLSDTGGVKNLSSLAFGGPDLRTAYLGCLLGDSLATFRTPVAGLPPSHWRLAT